MAIAAIVVTGSFLAWRLRAANRSGQERERPTVVHAWIRTAMVSVGLAGILLALAWVFGAWKFQNRLGWFDKSMQHWLTIKLPTVAIQQVGLQWIVVPVLLLTRMPKRRVVMIAAGIFAIVHLPNLVLMALTLVAGGCWVALYHWHGRLAPIVASHFLLAIVAAAGGGEYVLNMRVGTSCMQMVPRLIETKNRPMVVFPLCVSGNVFQVSQLGEWLYLDGWVRDDVHRQMPNQFFILAGDRLIAMESLAVDADLADRWKRRYPSENREHLFRARVSTKRLDKSDNLRLFAKNANGWFGELNSDGGLVWESSESAVSRPVAVYPAVVDGRVDHVECNDDGVRLIGWLADIENHTVPDSMMIRLKDRWINVDLRRHRVRRDDIAESVGDRRLANCGFDVTVRQFRLENASKLEIVAASEDAEMYYRIALTEQAQRQFSKSRTRISAAVSTEGPVHR